MKCVGEAIGFTASWGAFAIGIAGVLTGPPGWIMAGAFVTIVATGVSTGGLLNCLVNG